MRFESVYVERRQITSDISRKAIQIKIELPLKVKVKVHFPCFMLKYGITRVLLILLSVMPSLETETVTDYEYSGNEH